MTKSRDALSANGVDAAFLEAQLLACHALGVDRSWLFAHGEDIAPIKILDPLLARRMNHEPLAYIVGRREFYGRVFYVDPRVLIPRQETELLVEFALDWIRPRQGNRPKVLDLGAGSGCIAITVKCEFPQADVVATDISEGALDVARQNANALNVDIELVLSDMFAGLGDRQFDLILSNPPYIALSESLAEEVVGYEPRLALFSGQTGLELYERLAKEGASHLSSDGRLAVEVGYRQAISVAHIFTEHGWLHVGTMKDLGGIDRTVLFERAKRTPNDS
ncbi:MAG: peptide chain release factor N(5)-glutamine methyltransferase [Fimbriimonas sp.]|nr:peptide chain release factor N(5)-glutamine methyltransferase [Fimbriimonas sp.]